MYPTLSHINPCKSLKVYIKRRNNLKRYRGYCSFKRRITHHKVFCADPFHYPTLEGLKIIPSQFIKNIIEPSKGALEKVQKTVRIQGPKETYFAVLTL